MSGLNKEQMALFNAGFLQMKDGTLLTWKPNQPPDPLVVGMTHLAVSAKVAVKIPRNYEEDVEENIRAWNENNKRNKR